MGYWPILSEWVTGRHKSCSGPCNLGTDRQTALGITPKPMKHNDNEAESGLEPTCFSRPFPAAALSMLVFRRREEFLL